MKKLRKIHLNDVGDVNVRSHSHGFNLEFYDFKKRLTIVLHLERWWVRFIAKCLWTVVDFEQTEVNHLSNSLKNEDK